MSLDLIKLEDFQNQLAFTKNFDKISCVKGPYDYFHYKCDGYNDVGYGCGYRTTQTICSWIKNQILEENFKFSSNLKVVDQPSVLEIQKILVECGDKPSNFIGSKDWIGCFEASIVIDYLYNVPCKILHCNPGTLKNHYQDLLNHFENFASPVMMGGDLDNASKGVLGIGNSIHDSFVLIADPHYSVPKANQTELIKNEWIAWRSINSFDNSSFYNFCLPQKKYLSK
ncbi:unnamed protein product [Brachionus calyciflorus]|uniref:UFSP1/2/DUB catalytic domain-containing protein n=1 Tax=Brachionus calyciflorus TaxID=104777 RepID=A0A813YZE5_9BILA|nr:unnamed protein product [Brachionus calyciflorus]